jgi:replicative DNA helicase
MSVENLVIAELVSEGTPKIALQQGITEDDFEIYDEEWQWIISRAEQKKPITTRIFKEKFPEFEFLRTQERIQDLIEELKQERAFVAVGSAIDKVQVDLTPDNAVEQAMELREILSGVLRIHSPASDVLIKGDYKEHLEHMKRLHTLREAGESVGISSGFKNFDHHLGGFVQGRMYAVLARPGNTKSYSLAQFATQAMKEGRRVGFFSPEMNEFEHRCRVHTLLSADPKIQEAVGFRNAFRNRALMEGHGFNMKTYKRFLEYVDEEMKGEIVLFTQKWRRRKMSLSYIETRIEDMGIELCIIDPLYKLKRPAKRALRHEELADLVDGIQDLGKGFNIPMIVSNQAHRQQGNKGDAPHMDQSFGTDALAHEADHVIGIQHFEEERKLVYRCTKSRFGGNFRVDVAFFPNIGKMQDITPIRGDYFNGHDDDLDEKKLREIMNENTGEVEDGVEVDGS